MICKNVEKLKNKLVPAMVKKNPLRQKISAAFV